MSTYLTGDSSNLYHFNNRRFAGFTGLDGFEQLLINEDGSSAFAPIKIVGQQLLGATAAAVPGLGYSVGSYQWLRDGVAISGATSATYVLQAADVVVTNGALPRITVAVGGLLYTAPPMSGGDASAPPPQPVGPSIATQPQSQTVTAPNAATFSVVAAGTAPFSYQWTLGNVNIPGATSDTYTTPATSTSGSGGQYRVVITNGVSSITSGPATLTVISGIVAPTITVQPANQSVTAPATATFSVAATNGGGTLAYQWLIDGVGVSGATGQSFTTPATTTADNGKQVTVRVSNSAGFVISNAATLSVASGVDTRPLQVVGAGNATEATLFAAATRIATGTNGSRVVPSFTINAGTAGQYEYVFILQSACVNLGGGIYGATFTSGGLKGDWSGTPPQNANPTGNNNSGTEEVSRSNVTYVDTVGNTGTYVKFRTDFNVTYSGSIS